MTDQASPENLLTFIEYDIPQHLGLDRNKSSGADPDGVLVPDQIYNLVPDRRGSLIPFGRNFDMSAINIPPTLIGFDTRGLSSFRTDDNKLALFDGNTVRTSQASYASFDRTTHLSGAGAYAHASQFFAKTNDDVSPHYFEPFTITPNFEETAVGSSAASGSALAKDAIGGVGADSDVLGMVYYDYGGAIGERWAMVTREGHIKAGPSFNETGDEIKTVFASNRMNAIGVDENGFMVAVGDGGVIWRSSGGGSWNPSSSASGHELRDVIHDPQSGAWIAVGNDIQRSTDNGTNWTVVHSAGHPSGLNLYAVAVDGAGNFMAYGKNEEYQSGRLRGYSSPDGITWTVQSTLPSGGARPNAVTYGKGIWVAVTENGSVYNSPDGLDWLKVATLGSGSWLDEVIFDGDAFFAVGDAAKVYKSQDGVTWEPVEIEGLSGDMWAIVSHSNGNVYVAGEGGAGGQFTSAFGIEAGTYIVYWVVSVPTKAGLLAVDLSSREFVLGGEAGNTIHVELPTLAEIKAANGSPSWMNDTFLTTKVYVDVYLKSRLGATGASETQEDDVLADYGAHFDFTLRPGGGPEGADKQDETIDKLPIGRLLGDEGAAILVAFSNQDTVNHRERVWGVFSHEESDYVKSDDDVMLEAAQVVSGTALGYSDIGYANLARPGNYLPIVPGDSTTFVGMVSTPSGLLAFFDNEVHLISGDPNDGSLSVELYPDIIGADPGTKPTRLGGIAFSIWKGNIYALTGGQAQKLSQPGYLPDDKFVQVVAEPENRSLIALTEEGDVYRYTLDFQFWSNNVIGTCEYLLPNADADGTRYVNGRGVRKVLKNGQPATPQITYRDIDFGDKNRVDAVYGLRMAMLNYNPPSWSMPTLYYEIAEGDSITTDFVTGTKREEEFFFRLPRGKKSRMCDLRLVFNGMLHGDTVEPHVKILIVPGSKAMSARGSGGIPM